MNREIRKQAHNNVSVVTPPCVDINMNQIEMEGAVEKMQLYVALAKKEISRRKMESLSLRDELERSQRLMQSLQKILDNKICTVSSC